MSGAAEAKKSGHGRSGRDPGTRGSVFPCGHRVGRDAAGDSGRRGRRAPWERGEFLRVDRVVKNFAATAGAVSCSAGSGRSPPSPTCRSRCPTVPTFGLVGESGCGKTTIGRLIVGLEKPTSGRILLDGHDIARQSRHDRRLRARAVQVMFQDSYASMDPRMRVGTILREPLAIARDGSRADQRRRISDILGEVGLPASSVDRYPHDFSGGQRQRLGLARALIGGPSLIVADEPVSALDVSIQAQILNLMRDLQRQRGSQRRARYRSPSRPRRPRPDVGAPGGDERLEAGADGTEIRALRDVSARAP
jgi:peptide/nickel transport system ATP-binding protein